MRFVSAVSFIDRIVHCEFEGLCFLGTDKSKIRMLLNWVRDQTLIDLHTMMNAGKD